MPTYENPVTDAAEAYEALRGLAHATRSWDEPAETYRVIGEVVAGIRCLGQVLDQLAGGVFASPPRDGICRPASFSAPTP